MKLKIKTCLLLAAAAAAAFGGCVKLGQPRLKVDYYTLEYETGSVTNAAPIPAVIRVERFTAAPQYNTTRMVYRERPFSRETYHYHKWRAPPADLTTYFIARDLARSGVFAGVHPPGSSASATHVLEGTVDEFYERNLANRWESVLSITVSLMKAREPDPAKKLVFQRTYSFTEICAEKTPRSVAEAMSRAMSRATIQLTGDIHRELSGSL